MPGNSSSPWRRWNAANSLSAYAGVEPGAVVAHEVLAPSLAVLHADRDLRVPRARRELPGVAEQVAQGDVEQLRVAADPHVLRDDEGDLPLGSSAASSAPIVRARAVRSTSPSVMSRRVTRESVSRSSMSRAMRWEAARMRLR